MTAQLALLLALGIPTLGALAVALLHRWPNLREAATLGTGVLLFAIRRRQQSMCAQMPSPVPAARP